MSFFDHLDLLSEDPIFSIPKLFAADLRPQKVNLGIGSYKDSDGAPYILDCVRDAESALLQSLSDKDYLPIDGAPALLKQTKLLVFGKALCEKMGDQILTFQTVGGTGALYLGGLLLTQNRCKRIYIPNTTWPNHAQIFNRSGLEVLQYPYYNDKSHEIEFDGLCNKAASMPSGSVILLHACCQNPTGMDLSDAQWVALSDILKKQGVIPFFDFAYQGFKKNEEDDAFAVRYFASQGHELLVAQSFAKNFGLYGDRVGTLSLVVRSREVHEKAASQLRRLARSTYSNPPRHGAEVIASILSSEQSKKLWLKELANMRFRVHEMRHTLSAGLQAKGTGRDWTFLDRQGGFFSFCGLTEIEVKRLIQDYAIYMPLNGRINVSSLNGHNMDYVIDAILDVTRS